jgi:chaperone modulatory protein CbpM
MIRDTEVLARFSRLDMHLLQRWIAAGWVRPRESGAGFVFDEVDVARTSLICDLSFDMELRDEELAVVLSLVDRLNSTRTIVRALASAIDRQPAHVRDAIRSELIAFLGAGESGPSQS